MSYTLDFPIQYFPNPDRFATIGLGELYIGVVDGDPAAEPADRIQVYIARQNDTDLAIPQPIELSAGGVPFYLGSPVTLKIDQSFSVAVLDKNDQQVYYSPKTGEMIEELINLSNEIDEINDALLTQINNVAEMATLTPVVGKIYFLKEYITGTGKGGGRVVGKAGVITPNNVTTFLATTGLYFERLNIKYIHPWSAGCIESGDEAAKLQSAIDTAIALAIPLKGVGVYTANTGLVANGRLVLCSDGDGIAQLFKIQTNSSIELLKITADACSITNVAFEHNGALGRIVKFENAAACHMSGCSITAVHATNPDPLVYTNGSNTYIKGRNSFTNLRPNAHSIECDRTSWGININSQFDDNYFGGTGKGILIWSSDGAARPEGMTFSRNDLILTGATHVDLQSCLSCCIYDNMLDQCSGINIYLNPQASNIEDVDIRGRYLSSSSHTGVSGGVGIKLNPAAAGIASGINIEGVTFELMSYAIDLGQKAFGVSIKGNKFKSIDQTIVTIDQSLDVRIFDNKFNSAKPALNLTDGASGGAFQIDGNWFASGSSIVRTVTNASNFTWGHNSGLKTKGWSSLAAPTITGGTELFHNVPHGLSYTPDLNKVVVSAVLVSGDLKSITPVIRSVNATNVVCQINYSYVANSVVRLNVYCEI